MKKKDGLGAQYTEFDVLVVPARRRSGSLVIEGKQQR